MPLPTDLAEAHALILRQRDEAIALYRQHKADRIVAEVNNGGASDPMGCRFLISFAAGVGSGRRNLREENLLLYIF